MIDKLNFDTIIRHLHQYAEGEYIDIHDIHMAVSVVAGSNGVGYVEEVVRILIDINAIGTSEIDPSGLTQSVLKYKLL